MKKQFLLALFLAMSLVATGKTAQQQSSSKPNIVFILADDLGFADVGFNGGNEIKTPNIDKLAAAGARLDQFYVQPVCSPTRAALMTGRYPMRHGLQVGVVRPWAQYGLPLEERTLPQALKEAGYATAIMRQVAPRPLRAGVPADARGFDHQYGHYNGALDYFTHDPRRRVRLAPRRQGQPRRRLRARTCSPTKRCEVHQRARREEAALPVRAVQRRPRAAPGAGEVQGPVRRA